MRLRSFLLFSLVWVVPHSAHADFYVLEDDVMEGTPVGGDLRPGAFAQMYGLAIVETPSFGAGTAAASLIDELPGAGEFGRGTAPPVPTIVSVPPDELLTTHLLHFELPAGLDGPFVFNAKIFFDAEIVAILWTDEGLYGTDEPPVGAGFLQWAEDGRRLELDVGDGDVIRRTTGNTGIGVEIHVGPSDPIDQIRVITLARSPDADVYLECDGAIVIEGDGSVSFEGNIVNDGMESSLPIALRVAWNPDRTEMPGGGLTLGGTPYTCDGMSPATCPLGRVGVGSHRLRADIVGAPGETIGIDVMLVGAGTSNETCHLQGVIPLDVPILDAGPGADSGAEPIPADIIPTFNGGGGCVCEVGSSSPSTPATWALFIGLGLLLVSRRR